MTASRLYAVTPTQEALRVAADHVVYQTDRGLTHGELLDAIGASRRVPLNNAAVILEYARTWMRLGVG